jgi:two-component system, cell cycle response regulator
VTSYAMVGDRNVAVAAGFDGYLTKPITPSTFVSQLEVFLRPGQSQLPPPLAAESQVAPQIEDCLRERNGDHHGDDTGR